MVTNPDQLSSVDPFIPFVSINSAIVVQETVNKHPLDRIGIVLRSCEARALQQMVLDRRLSLENLLLIGVDCMGSFPIDEFEWRYQKKGALDRITRESLQFSRQGGIAPYRLRTTCQICSTPTNGNVDIRVGIIGLPSIQMLLIVLENEELAEQINLSEIGDYPAEQSVLDQRRRLLKTIIQRHQSVNSRLLDNLSSDLPCTLNEIRDLLSKCSPCKNCLEACAIYPGVKNFWNANNQIDLSGLERWIISCVSCGMCEQTCPQHLPLPMIIKKIRKELMRELVH
ncbi:MAG: Coenzyme F420 hydrogenase/dehydrogenase, beta subunit C-terminal domain [Anaerolineales bacterium]|nr:Coenzyme F420 hydrogenase/dehydrogenase, beta subunit C-terminal domain [Anaerolineales bacterium]